jgi:small GTP-binding protein|tara:strand:+ start:4669 stop:5268 length:600 start_codon:yes stop_codon:yes gene_type:complete
MKPYDYLFKTIVVGDTNSGKTSLINNISNSNSNTQKLPTIGVDYASVITDHEGIKIKIQIWDTAGQEKFAPIIRSYYNAVCCVVFVFDLSEKKSFDNLNIWIDDVNNHCKNENLIKILVGNKKDETSYISKENIQSFTEEHKLTYIETSAKTKENNAKLLELITSSIYENKDELDSGITTYSFKLSEEKKYRYGCCITS